MTLLILLATTNMQCYAMDFLDGGLREIKYSHYKNTNTTINTNLETLAKKGDIQSQRYYADMLATKNDRKSSIEAIKWYKSSFRNGTGDITSLIPLVKLVHPIEKLNNDMTQWVAHAISQIQYFDSNQNVNIMLEIFLYYPALFKKSTVDNLIKQHNKACIDNCKRHLYAARYEQVFGDKNRSIALYEKAIMFDGRAVEYYYLLLSDDRNNKFITYAENSWENINNFPAESAGKIGEILKGTHLNEEGKQIHSVDVDNWLNYSIQKEYKGAYVTKIQYILAFPDQYNPEQFDTLITSLSSWSPNWADYYKAAGLLTIKWRNIKPIEAKKLYNNLISNEFWPAYMGLAKLQSIGAEDEVNQVEAINLYNIAAEKGLIEADYQIANIYNHSKGICRDTVKAYAHISLAKENGVLPAYKLEEVIRDKLTDDNLIEARLYYNKINEARQ